MRSVLLGFVFFFSLKPICESLECSLSIYCFFHDDPHDHANTICTKKKVPDGTNINDCINIKEATNTHRDELVKQHNEFRNKIASGKVPGWPPAANMRKISWDADLETLAYLWASQCENYNDNCRRTPAFRQPAQQLIGDATHAPKPYPRAAAIFQELWDDIVSATSNNSEEFVAAYPDSQSTNIAAKAIWGETYKLGCGVVHSIYKWDNLNWQRLRCVCNYGPYAGVNGARMYEVGPPCTKCPSGTECNKQSAYPNLCDGPDPETFYGSPFPRKDLPCDTFSGEYDKNFKPSNSRAILIALILALIY